MHARLGTVQMSPRTFEQGIKILSTQALPSIRLLDGFRGVVILGDAETGKALYLSLWETEEDMRRSESEAGVLRQDTAEALGVGDIPVEGYEVRVFELADG